MLLRFYNTLTGKKEEFKALEDNLVRMYHCGPTVYNYAHIGNLRAYVFADVLRRTLEYNGYRVQQVINITDIGHLSSDADEGEDKMVKALKRERKPLTLEAMKEVADFYANVFRQDLRRLNIQPPTLMPRASEHIPEDIALIKKLEAKGIAYKTRDGVYFNVSKFPDYGARGGFKLGNLKEGARVEVNSEKKNSRDFALWKFAEGDIGFESPWGGGFPGWHLECSAMSRKYLGQPFDIHTGGVDHITLHHQNEIAQSEGAYGVPLAKYWMHSEFVTVVGGEKMAKSDENFRTLDSLNLKRLSVDEGMMPLAYRLWLLTAQYQQKIEFSLMAVLAQQTFYQRVLNQIDWEAKSGQVNEAYREHFARAINNNLDTPKAISLISGIIKDESIAPADKKATINEFDKVLGLNFQVMASKLGVAKVAKIPTAIQKLATAREDARRGKDFKKSDELREQIQKEGFEVTDTDSGPIIRKKI